MARTLASVEPEEERAKLIVGKIGDNQLHNLAKRRGATAEDLERLLALN